LTVPEKKSRILLPSTVRLLTTSGVRGHTLMFGVVTAALFGIAFVGRAVYSPGQAWTAVFAVGVSATGTYLVLSALTLVEKTQSILLHSRMLVRAGLSTAIFGATLGGLAYWIQQVGSVEALPIFPVLIAIFYGWVVLQSYFIATPVSHLLTRAETGITGGSSRSKILRTLGTTLLFVPIIPLGYAVYAVSSWAYSNYQNVQDATAKIIAWSAIMMITLVGSYFLTLRWSWRKVKESPQTAVFAGGMFLIMWSYLLYRSTSVLIGFITQNQPSNPLVDSALIIVSIIGALQTFARKAIRMTNKRLSHAIPFLVFAFGAAYSVAQFYFILQFISSRVDLSIIVNTVVFATGLAILLFIIRKHSLQISPTTMVAQTGAKASVPEQVQDSQNGTALVTANDPAQSPGSQQRKVHLFLRLQTNGSQDEDSRGEDIPAFTLRSLHANPSERTKTLLDSRGFYPRMAVAISGYRKGFLSKINHTRSA
jgi:hypothetical protein